MTDSIREQVLQAFTAKVTELEPGITGLRVERNRDTEVGHFPTLVILDAGESVTDENSYFTLFDMEVDVEGWIEAKTTEQPGTITNALYAKVVQKALSDQTLGDKCISIKQSETLFEHERGAGQKKIGRFQATFTIQYQTAAGNPFAYAPNT